MEEVIKNLDEWTDPATKKMLQNVVIKKRKFMQIKKQHQLITWLAIICFIFYLYYFYHVIYSPNSYSMLAVFSSFITDDYNPYLVALTIGVYGFMIVWKQKKDEAEEKYEDLRCEIIDKSNDLWKQEKAWQNRHLVFEIMKSHFDIDLYNESK